MRDGFTGDVRGTGGRFTGFTGRETRDGGTNPQMVRMVRDCEEERIHRLHRFHRWRGTGRTGLTGFTDEDEGRRDESTDGTDFAGRATDDRSLSSRLRTPAAWSGDCALLAAGKGRGLGPDPAPGTEHDASVQTRVQRREPPLIRQGPPACETPQTAKAAGSRHRRGDQSLCPTPPAGGEHARPSRLPPLARDESHRSGRRGSAG